MNQTRAPRVTTHTVIESSTGRTLYMADAEQFMCLLARYSEELALSDGLAYFLEHYEIGPLGIWRLKLSLESLRNLMEIGHTPVGNYDDIDGWKDWPRKPPDNPLFRWKDLV
jgi:hypothetical protein